MSKILAIIKLNLLETIRDKRTLFFLILFPLIFTFIFGKAFGSGGSSGVPVVFADLDKATYSRYLLDTLQANKSIQLISKRDRDEAVKAIKDKKADLAIVIPKGFSADLMGDRKVTVETITLPNSNTGLALKEVFNGVVNRLEANSGAASETVDKKLKAQKITKDDASQTWKKVFQEAEKKWSPQPPLSVKYQELSAKGQEKEFNSMTHYSLGFAVAFVMFTITFSAGGILQEKEKGTWNRVLSTPTRPSLILGGHLISTFIIGWLQIAILILFGQFAFNVDWGSNIFRVIIVMSFYLFAVTGLGLMITSFVKTHAQLQAIAQLILPAFAMLGGCYWPLDIVPKIMQKIAAYIPTGQAMSALLNVVARGKSLADVQMSLYILLAMGVVFFAIGLKRIRA
jgi:ABC-2 type transport system permease protein